MYPVEPIFQFGGSLLKKSRKWLTIMNSACSIRWKKFSAIVCQCIICSKLRGWCLRSESMHRKCSESSGSVFCTPIIVWSLQNQERDECICPLYKSILSAVQFSPSFKHRSQQWMNEMEKMEEKDKPKSEKRSFTPEPKTEITEPELNGIDFGYVPPFSTLSLPDAHANALVPPAWP